jgi:hypothetical protein
MEWAHEMLLSVTDDFVDQFRSIGIVEALASIFKVCMYLIFTSYSVFYTCGGYVFAFIAFLFYLSLNRSSFTHMILFCGCQQGMNVRICFHKLHIVHLH